MYLSRDDSQCKAHEAEYMGEGNGMKRKVKVRISLEKIGLFGITKTVMETSTIEVDSRTYKSTRP